VCQKATQVIEEMEARGIKPNLKTYTTLIHGWARAAFPDKALKCFEEMKVAGLKPDRAVYHCLMTSLLSRTTDARSHIYSGLLSICREMIESEITVDMGTAVHWARCLYKIERTGGELTEALQKTFPPDWTSHSILADDCEIETADSEIVDSEYEIVYHSSESDNDESTHAEDYDNDVI
jgi:pentatricopeptide repeat protein